MLRYSKFSLFLRAPLRNYIPKVESALYDIWDNKFVWIYKNRSVCCNKQQRCKNLPISLDMALDEFKEYISKEQNLIARIGNFLLNAI